MWQLLKDEVREGYLFVQFGIRSWIDDHLAAGGRIFCGKGCRNCCNLVVHTTLTEALCIYDRLPPNNADEVDEKAQLVLEECRRAPDLKTFLARTRAHTGFCPLLSSDGTCSVYPVRPFSCRALLSTMDASFCAVDFAQMSQEEKESYVSQLDRSVVAYPLHYVAATRDLAAAQESVALRRMAQLLGFSLYGNLPLLLHLERRYGLSSVSTGGFSRVRQLLQDAGCYHPFLITLNEEESNEVYEAQ